MDSHPFKPLVCFLRSFFSVLDKTLLSFLSSSFWTGKHLCVWLEWWDAIHLCQCYAWFEVPLEFIQSGCVSSQVCVRSGKLLHNLSILQVLKLNPFIYYSCNVAKTLATNKIKCLWKTREGKEAKSTRKHKEKLTVLIPRKLTLV